MYVYRAYYGWYDEYTHIGLFSTSEKAWVACYKYYKKNLSYHICWKHFNKPHFGYGCECPKHRLRSSRYKRLHIKKEIIK